MSNNVFSLNITTKKRKHITGPKRKSYQENRQELEEKEDE